jgi:hypothetical protein
MLYFLLFVKHYGRCGWQTVNDSLVFIHHSRTHKKTHTTGRGEKKREKKLTNLMGNLCCAREHSV